MPSSNKKNRLHRTQNAWKKDVLRLTILCRLRVDPPIEYNVIAEILFVCKKQIVGNLYELLGPDTWPVVGEVPVHEDLEVKIGKAKEWLAGYARQVCERAEREKGVQWCRIRDLDAGEVKAWVGEVYERFCAAEDDGSTEGKRQRVWRVTGDWRAGSQEDLMGIGRESMTAPVYDSEYPKDRVLFFENMVDWIVDQDFYSLKNRTVLTNVVGSPIFDTIEVQDEELGWTAPKIEYPSTYGQSMEEGYAVLLAQLQDIKLVIKDYDLKLSILKDEQSVTQDAQPISEIAGRSRDTSISLPELGHFNDIDLESTATSEGLCKTPELVPEVPFDVWHGFTGDEEDTGPSAMRVETDKAYKAYQSTRGKQKWLKMSH